MFAYGSASKMWVKVPYGAFCLILEGSPITKEKRGDTFMGPGPSEGWKFLLVPLLRKGLSVPDDYTNLIHVE